MESTNEQAERKWLRKTCLVLLLALVVLVVSGCKTIGFYAQAIKGQYQILAHQQPVAKLVVAPATPPPLKQRLLLLQSLRRFAETNLLLPLDGNYTKYVDVHRPFVVWNVEAAPEFSLEAHTWWYPLVGSLKYRGYFSLAGATNYAAYLRRKGLDVSVGGVEAYSTLGWFKDPALNTFVFEPDADLAELIFHETAHKRVFASGDTDFNEAFATAVGQEGTLRWLRSRRDGTAFNVYQAQLQRTREFARLVDQTRLQLLALYGDTRTADGKIKATSRMEKIPRAQLRQQKQKILDGMKQEHARLKGHWGGKSDYDSWFVRPVNNAHLNGFAAYYDLVPGFEQLLMLNGGDLEKFYASAERLTSKTKKERHEWLLSLAKARTSSPSPVR